MLHFFIVSASFLHLLSITSISIDLRVSARGSSNLSPPPSAYLMQGIHLACQILPIARSKIGFYGERKVGFIQFLVSTEEIPSLEDLKRSASGATFYPKAEVSSLTISDPEALPGTQRECPPVSTRLVSLCHTVGHCLLKLR